eukprot:COSAG02_NODE_2579_length_8493_cov_28.456040_3_plen_116_part_00
MQLRLHINGSVRFDPASVDAGTEGAAPRARVRTRATSLRRLGGPALRSVNEILGLEICKDHQTCDRQVGLRAITRNPPLCSIQNISCNQQYPHHVCDYHSKQRGNAPAPRSPNWQ